MWAWKCLIAWYFYTYVHLKFHAQLRLAWKQLYDLGPGKVEQRVLQSGM